METVKVISYNGVIGIYKRRGTNFKDYDRDVHSKKFRYFFRHVYPNMWLPMKYIGIKYGQRI